MLRETRTLRASLSCALLCALSACSSAEKPRGELMIAVATDMSIPKNLDQVEVLISLPDGTQQRLDYPILPSSPNPVGKPMPGTLAVVPSNAGGQTVRVRLIAQQDSSGGNPVSRVVREAIVKVPTDRVALLPMPLHWLCDGVVKQDKDGSYIADCDDPDQTCVAGKCVDAAVATDKLKTFDPGLVFGGGDDQGNGGTCIDVQACFAASTLAMPDKDCTLPMPKSADPTSFNVAIELSSGSDGQCTAGADSRCFLPLDSDPDEGFQIVGDRVQLPSVVCEKIAKGKALGVVTTSACPTKDPSEPICGPWTTVTTSSTDSGGGSSTGGTSSGGTNAGGDTSTGNTGAGGSSGAGKGGIAGGANGAAGSGTAGSANGGTGGKGAQAGDAGATSTAGSATGGTVGAGGTGGGVAEGPCPSGALGHCDAGAVYPFYPGYTLALVEDFPAPLNLDADPIFTWSDGGPTDAQTGFRESQISFVSGKMRITADSTCPVTTDNSAPCYLARTCYADPAPNMSTGTVPPKSVWSGELRTKYNNYRYGRYEVKMHAPTANPDLMKTGGFLHNMFVYRSPRWQTWNQISMTLQANTPTAVAGNVINIVGQDTYPLTANDSWVTPATADVTNITVDHVYAFTWTPTLIAWFVDNVQVQTFSGNGTVPIPTLSSKILMDLYVFSGNTFGEGADNVYPMQAEFDYFRFYKLNTEAIYPCSPTPTCLPPADRPASAQNNPNEKNYGN